MNWILMRDAHPTARGWYLCSLFDTSQAWVELLWWTGTRWDYDDCEAWPVCEVYAWTALPEPAEFAEVAHA